ncbi:dihydropyrimidinase [Gymnodinialimonas hymeniacidonis]|uniref:dihydropyrimidinase n=1 Tax=Gymnodinialimonas hymeniacidonis TaxID=3126508 RepID=UPI0034C6DDF9
MRHQAEFVIRGAEVLDRKGRRRADILVSDGKIAAIGADLDASLPTHAADGLLATPGGVDPHAHIEQKSGMGLWNADTFETATRSAALGGTTSVISFAAQGKGERLRDVVADYSARAERGAMIDYAFHLSLSDPDAPHFDDDLRTLIAAGHRTVKVFTTYNIALNSDQIRHILSITGPAGALTCVHAEDDAILTEARNALIAEGKTEPKHHARARPRAAEAEAIKHICAMAEELSAPVMIFHVTCIEALDAVRAARQRGAPVFAETCTHYLFQTEDILDQGIDGAKWMCSPPQRNEADQVALWDGLKDGSLDLVSSDHAPYRYDETGKLRTGPNPPFPEIANGQPGLEVRQPLLFDSIVFKAKMPETAFANLTATRAAEIYNLPGKGVLEAGADADIVLWDPTRTYTYGADDLHDNVGYNPHEGRTVTGWPVHVFLRGHRIVSDSALTTQPGQGRWINRRPT